MAAMVWGHSIYSSWPPLSVCHAHKHQFFPKMVKKCLGSILLREKHSRLYLSMLLWRELFTLNKNRRNVGGWMGGEKNLSFSWMLETWLKFSRSRIVRKAEWVDLWEAEPTVLWPAAWHKCKQEFFSAPWIQRASKYMNLYPTDSRCLEKNTTSSGQKICSVLPTYRIYLQALPLQEEESSGAPLMVWGLTCRPKPGHLSDTAWNQERNQGVKVSTWYEL